MRKVQFCDKLKVLRKRACLTDICIYDMNKYF